MLGKNLVTSQTDAKGLPVNSVYVEKPSNIARELYLSALVDRTQEKIVFMASPAGGMDIEKVAHETPERIQHVFVSPAAGLPPYQARELSFFRDLTKDQIGRASCRERLCMYVYITVVAGSVTKNIHQ